MHKVFIVDTNVLIAGIISSNKVSPVVHIVNSMLDGSIPYLLSPSLLREYRDVLLRPKLCKLHRLNEESIDQLLTEIIANAIFCEPRKGNDAPDKGDNHLWDLLQHHKNSTLITGDLLLLEKPLQETSVIMPATYMDIFSK